MEGSEEIVAIRIQDGTDCELKFCDTYSREGYNLTDNCIIELSSVDSLDSSVKKMYAEMYRNATDTSSLSIYNLWLETELSRKIQQTHVPDDREKQDDQEVFYEVSADGREKVEEDFIRALEEFLGSLTH